MRYGIGWVALVALLAAPPAFAVSNSPFGCPPSATATTDPSEDPELVLAQGAPLLTVPVAGHSNAVVGHLPAGRHVSRHRRLRQLQLVRPGAEPRPVSGVPVVLTVGQGGLLDVAVDLDFATNNIVYLSYLSGSEDASTIRVLRAKLSGSSETLTERKVIFESSPRAGPELSVDTSRSPPAVSSLTLGDRWARDLAQDRSDDDGSIIRIRTDGTIPDDNPFRWLSGARPEIWSYGHRNPQGLAFNARTGRLWSDEHEPPRWRRAQSDCQGAQLWMARHHLWATFPASLSASVPTSRAWSSPSTTGRRSR